jgi:hypothetical protein
MLVYNFTDHTDFIWFWGILVIVNWFDCVLAKKGKIENIDLLNWLIGIIWWELWVTVQIFMNKSANLPFDYGIF